jgi:c-di-GMP-binding flagellar brake protein YcgR
MFRGDMKGAKDPREKRRYRRVKIMQDIYFGHRDQRRMDDLSEEGMFIAAPANYLSESVLDLKFRLFNDDVPIEVQAEVRYVEEGVGMGLRFLDLKPEDRKRIRKFVERF